MLFPEENDPPAQINIVPMIDVVFALLTFFIISTLFLTRSEGLPVNLPRAATAKTQQQTKIAVSIKPNGELALNKRSIQLSELEIGVKALIQANTRAVVVIHADEKVEHGQLVAVMDEIRKIDGVKMAIATKRR
jgi:biopolymer transport protein ExbD